MAKPLSAPSHSADVRMHLRVNGHTLPIRQLGGDFLILEKSIDHPAAEAELYLAIDGHERRRTIWLARGLNSAECEVDISRERNVCPTSPSAPA